METPVAFTLPVRPPTAVTVPAVKLPDASLETIADAVFAEVALEVTVKVAAPELLKVVEPDNPVPEVFSVRVFASDPEKEEAVTIPEAFTVVAWRNAAVETPEALKLPLTPTDAVTFPEKVERPVTRSAGNVAPPDPPKIYCETCCAVTFLLVPLAPESIMNKSVPATEAAHAPTSDH